MILQFRPFRLVFLGNTWHDGDDDHVFFLDAHLFRKIVLGDGTEHLMRRLAGGWYIQKIRELMLEEFHPCRTAAGQNRKIFVFRDSINHFMGFFHDGQIRCEVGVKHIIKSKILQGGDHLPGHHRSWLKSEEFTQGYSHRWCHLDHNGLVFLLQRSPYFRHIVHFH